MPKWKKQGIKRTTLNQNQTPTEQIPEFPMSEIRSWFSGLQRAWQVHFSSSAVHSTHTACLTCCASSSLNLLLSLEVLPWSWHLWYAVVSTATEVRPSRRASHGLLEDSDFVHGTMPHLLSVSSLILESLHLQLRLQIHHSSSQSLTTALHNSFCPAKSTKSSIT